MSQQTEDEIDPSEISEEVSEFFANKSHVDPEEAEAIANKAQFEQMNFTEPNKKSTVEVIQSKIANLVEKARNHLSERRIRSTRPIISDVEVTDNNRIILHVEHPKRTNHKIQFTQEDQAIANLMAHHNVDTPMELKGKRLIFNDPEPKEETKLLIPNNASFIGQIRYRLFARIQEFIIKTKLLQLQDKAFVFAFLLPVFFGIAVLGLVTAIASPVLPVRIAALIPTILFFGWIFRVTLYILQYLLKRPFYEV